MRKSLTRWLVVIVLVSSVGVLDGCNSTCDARNGIPERCMTFVPRTPPTPRPTPMPLTDPKQVVTRFMAAYTDNVPDYSSLFDYFDAAYDTVSRSAMSCMGKQSRLNTGNFSSYQISDAVINGPLAEVVTTGNNLIYRDRAMNFILKQQATVGWRIDRILGWISGDITPQTPVGDNVDSCIGSSP